MVTTLSLLPARSRAHPLLTSAFPVNRGRHFSRFAPWHYQYYFVSVIRSGLVALFLSALVSLAVYQAAILAVIEGVCFVTVIAHAPYALFAQSRIELLTSAGRFFTFVSASLTGVKLLRQDAAFLLMMVVFILLLLHGVFTLVGTA